MTATNTSGMLPTTSPDTESLISEMKLYGILATVLPVLAYPFLPTDPNASYHALFRLLTGFPAFLRIVDMCRWAFDKPLYVGFPPWVFSLTIISVLLCNWEVTRRSLVDLELGDASVDKENSHMENGDTKTDVPDENFHPHSPGLGDPKSKNRTIIVYTYFYATYLLWKYLMNVFSVHIKPLDSLYDVVCAELQFAMFVGVALWSSGTYEGLGFSIYHRLATRRIPGWFWIRADGQIDESAEPLGSTLFVCAVILEPVLVWLFLLRSS